MRRRSEIDRSPRIAARYLYLRRRNCVLGSRIYFERKDSERHDDH